MPEDNQAPVANPTNPASDAAANATTEALAGMAADIGEMDKLTEVGQKIAESHNVLIALSSDPSVDEMAAAIGLSLYLDRLGKRATAIYSGNTPNALEFLKPEETFEESVDTLQDFVIALDKEKADHLRYKLDGDFVKIFITPYKTRIDEEDLEFSYGDFNVDLVLALDVANGIDLDTALREHGRIMHDAVIVNITTGNPGKLGEIEWSDKHASSVSEMIADLLYKANSKIQIEKEEATAFLTGIVAATNRFSKANTTPDTMKIASKLMESGANQQLISKNITPDVENEIFSMPGLNVEKKKDDDASKLDIQHGNEEIPEDNPEEVDATVTEKESTLLEELKQAEANLAAAGAETVPDDSNKTVDVNNIDAAIAEAPAENGGNGEVGQNGENSQTGQTGGQTDQTDQTGQTGNFLNTKPEKVLQPTGDFAGFDGANAEDDNSRYGKMLEEALAGAGAEQAAESAPIVSTEPEVPASVPIVAPEVPATEPIAEPAPAPAPELPAVDAGGTNPAAMGAPAVSEAPEINGVPEMNYGATEPEEAILPPPPAPPVSNDPGAFQIPGAT